MYWATGELPTNDTPAMPGWSRIASTASFAPWTRFTTPSGKPASCSSSNMRICDSGTRSLGLTMNVLPQATACGRNHIGTMAGKLNGVMAANTPSGCR